MSTPLRVLIVEDSEDDTLLVLRELHRGGYEPTFERVDTPEAMNAALEQQTWDIVLSDYAMPRCSMPAALSSLPEGCRLSGYPEITRREARLGRCGAPERGALKRGTPP